MGSEKKRKPSEGDLAEGAEEELTKKQKKKLREEKRAQKAVEESEAADGGAEEITSGKDTEGGKTSSEEGDEGSKKKPPAKSRDELGSSEQEQHSKKLAKMLPTRVEKSRRDQQKKIQAFVIDLKAKGVTDPKQVKKEKLKYKKLLEKRQQSRGGGRKRS